MGWRPSLMALGAEVAVVVLSAASSSGAPPDAENASARPSAALAVSVVDPLDRGAALVSPPLWLPDQKQTDVSVLTSETGVGWIDLATAIGDAL